MKEKLTNTMNEDFSVYCVKGNGFIWGKPFDRLDMAKVYLTHIRKKFDKTAKLYEVKQEWKEVE